MRDSTLNATNDVEMFMESFEAVALVGSEALALTVGLDPSGATSGTIDISTLTPSPPSPHLHRHPVARAGAVSPARVCAVGVALAFMHHEVARQAGGSGDR